MFKQHYFCPSSEEIRFNQTMDNKKPKGLRNQCLGQLSASYNNSYFELPTRSKSCFHGDLQCPICLQVPTFPMETSCGHLFCGPCLIEYWRHGSWLGPVSCPLCRRKVSLLYGLSHENHQERCGQQILRDIKDYNKRFSGQPRSLADYVFDVPLLLQMVFRRLLSMVGLVWIFCLRIAICFFGTIVHLTSPLNIIPEAFNEILRTFDDFTVVILLLFFMVNIYQQAGLEQTSQTNTTTQSLQPDIS